MLEKESMEPQVIRKMEEMEGGRRPTGISSIKETKTIHGIRAVPDPEVREKAVRRRFTAEYKLGILKEAGSCKEQGSSAPCCAEKGFIRPISLHGDVRWKKGRWKPCHPRREGRKPKDPIHRSVALPNLSERIKSCRKNSGRQRPL